MEIKGNINAGYGNTIGTGTTKSSILGGENNTINTTGGNNFSDIIGGGNENKIYGYSYGGGNFIGGGGSGYQYANGPSYVGNTINGGSGNVIVGGYYGNVISGGTYGSIIGGGQSNVIGSGGQRSVIVGGEFNTINTTENFIGGGESNTTSNSAWSSIVGGKGNQIGPIFSKYGFVGGGKDNIIAATYSSILGGQNNIISGHTHSHIIGSNITSVSANTTHVEKLNIKTLNTGSTPTTVLAIDTNGMVVDGVTLVGSSGNLWASSFGSNSIIANNGTGNLAYGKENTVIGYSNIIYSGGNNSAYSSIGGENNVISATTNTTIVNGRYNNVTDSHYSFMGGGYQNKITNSFANAIVGGTQNVVVNSAFYSNIGGGYQNKISGATHSSIIGGQFNIITSAHTHSHIIGSNITSVSANTTHVEKLNIKTLNTGTTAVSSLGLDINGMVVSVTDATTASNGLTKTGDNITLGGTLTGDTNIDLSGSIITFEGESLRLLSDATELVEFAMAAGLAGGGLGFRGFSDISFPNYGKQGDMFIRSGADSNGLSIISYPGTGTDDSIRFFAGDPLGASGTPNIHIQGSGSTMGFVALGHGTPTEKLDVLGSIKMVDGNETNGYVMTSDGNGVGSWQVSSGGGVTIDPYNVEPSTTSLTWDVSGTSTNYETTLTGNTTLTMSNVRNGDYGTLIVIQDGTGSHTLTFGAGTHRVVNGGGGSPTLTATAGAIDILSFTYNGSTFYWTVGNDYT